MHTVALLCRLVAVATTVSAGSAVAQSTTTRQTVVTQSVTQIPMNHGLQEGCVLHDRENPATAAFFGLQVKNARSVKNTPHIVVTGFVNMKTESERALSPARGSGVRTGDIVLSFAGCPVSYGRQFIDLLWRFTPGNTAVIKIERAGQVHAFMITSVNIPASLAPEYPPQESSTVYWR